MEKIDGTQADNFANQIGGCQLLRIIAITGGYLQFHSSQYFATSIIQFAAKLFCYTQENNSMEVSHILYIFRLILYSVIS